MVIAFFLYHIQDNTNDIFLAKWIVSEMPRNMLYRLKPILLRIISGPNFAFYGNLTATFRNFWIAKFFYHVTEDQNYVSSEN